MAKNTLVLAMPEWRVSGNPIHVDLWTVFKEEEGERRGNLTYRYVDMDGDVRTSPDKGQFKKIPIANGNPYVLNFDSNDVKSKAMCDFIMTLPQITDADGVQRKKVGAPTNKIPVNGYYTLDRSTFNYEKIALNSYVMTHFLALSLRDKVLVALKYGQNIEGYAHSRIIELMCDLGYDLIMPVKNHEMNWVQEKPQLRPKGVFWQGANAVDYVKTMKAGLKTFEKEITIQKGIIAGTIEFATATGYSFGGQYVGTDHLAVNKSFSDHPELFMLLQNQVAKKDFNNEDDLKGKQIESEEKISEPTPVKNVSHETVEEDLGFEELITTKNKKKAVAV